MVTFLVRGTSETAASVTAKLLSRIQPCNSCVAKLSGVILIAGTIINYHISCFMHDAGTPNWRVAHNAKQEPLGSRVNTALGAINLLRTTSS